nr:MAG TPA: hypothetical protein [Caudoviricetes sp.]
MLRDEVFGAALCACGMGHFDHIFRALHYIHESSK